MTVFGMISRWMETSQDWVIGHGEWGST